MIENISTPLVSLQGTTGFPSSSLRQIIALPEVLLRMYAATTVPSQRCAWKKIWRTSSFSGCSSHFSQRLIGCFLFSITLWTRPRASDSFLFSARLNLLFHAPNSTMLQGLLAPDRGRASCYRVLPQFVHQLRCAQSHGYTVLSPFS